MNKTQLAKNLDISRTQLYKLEARGMPTNKGLEAAKKWRNSWLNMDITQSKGYRVDGNRGVNRESTQVNYSDELNDSFDIGSELNNIDVESGLTHAETLADTVPEIWFGQVGWLGSALKDHDIKITAEQLLKVQQTLLMIYMETVTEYLDAEDDEVFFYVPQVLKANPGDEIYPSLIARLNQILDTEPAH